MNKTPQNVAWLAVVLAGSVALVSCALAPASSTSPTAQQIDEATRQVMQSSFRAQGVAKLERLTLDASNRACSDAVGAPLDQKLAQSIEAANLQNGRGLTWSDKPGDVNGGSCYNCHQISQAELSFGTIGPSLYHYGKLRGVSDPAAAASQAVVQYTWGKLWNAKAYKACSDMPRFGHAGILSEQQIRDLMALLLDPQSPVNR